MSPRKFLACLPIVLAGCAPTHYHTDLRHEMHHGAGPLRSAGETTLTGFTFPESVGCDPRQNVLYVSQFGGKELNPLAKDGLGYISKVATNGVVLEQKAFDVTMNKPKGIWIAGDRLWVTDIDGVWIFDTQSKKSRKVTIPGAQFANDPAVVRGAVYVSDNRSDSVFRIEPADFLDAGVQPKVTTVWTQKGVNPNGLWPTRDGSLIVVGWTDQPRGIHIMGANDEMKTVVQPFGRLDGVFQLHDGSLLLTDWTTGTLNHWSEGGGLVPLAKDFKGPADFCVMHGTAYVPDLVKSEIRVVKLTR